MKQNFAGLSTEEVNSSREKNGSNELAPQEVESFWDKLAGNFKDPMIIILCVAFTIIMIMSFFHLAEWYEGVGVAVAVIMATFVSTFSEFKNESSFQKLQEEASRIKNNVFRNGKIESVFVNEIVAGDYVLLQPGDKIPADGKLAQGEIKVNQASLTGESEPLNKEKALENYQTKENDFSDPYLVFRGTVVEDDEAVMIVDTVGGNTFYGKLAKELSLSSDRQSPLQVKLSALADGISKFGYTGALFITLSYMLKKIVIDNNFSPDKISAYFDNLGIFFHDAFMAVILAIVIIVAAVPEGLPMMIAIVLSLNMRKLLNSKVLVRKLLGIETSGSLNILYSDKTGTITYGRLEARVFMTGDKKTYDRSGSIPEKLREIAGFAVRENTSSVVEPSGKIFGGNISERAILEFFDKEILLNKLEIDSEKKIPFSSSRKFSAIQIKGVQDFPEIGKNSITLIKGAPEIILDKCHYYYSQEGKKLQLNNLGELQKEVDTLAARGMRTLAIATSDDNLDEENKTLPAEMTLVGIFGIRDEIREESKTAIENAQKAGIQVVMITGDKKETAVAIAKEVGLIKDENDKVLTSAELSQLSDEQLKKMIPDLRVIARALPTDKSRLVKNSQELGLVVGMTGDGVNDSAALKKADVGFAMGSGSEVAKEAGDIVILDDNFSSITKAILYGRTIFKSIRKFIIFQLTINISAVSISFLAPLLNLETPLTIVQILWINVIMDTLAALAFGGEAALQRYMKEKPVKRESPIVGRDMWASILTNGLFICALSIFFLKSEWIISLFSRGGEADKTVYLTAFFSFFIFITVFNGFNARTETLNLFEKLSENKGFIQVFIAIFTIQVLLTFFGGKIMRTVPLTFEEWVYVSLLALLIIPVDLTRKLIRNAMKTKRVSTK